MSRPLTTEQRKHYNQRLASILDSIVRTHPDMRFSQILATFDFVVRDYEGHWKEEYYVEPDVILARVIEALGRVG